MKERSKSIKLSKTQLEVLQLMAKGWELTTLGCFSGHVTWVNLDKLTQHNYPKSHDKIIRVSDATVHSLRNKGLIYIPCPKNIECINIYILTEKGKEVVKNAIMS